MPLFVKALCPRRPKARAVDRFAASDIAHAAAFIPIRSAVGTSPFSTSLFRR